MNSLVGLGATASFAVSAVAALLPKLGERLEGKGWAHCLQGARHVPARLGAAAAAVHDQRQPGCTALQPQAT